MSDMKVPKAVSDIVSGHSEIFNQRVSNPDTLAQLFYGASGDIANVTLQLSVNGNVQNVAAASWEQSADPAAYNANNPAYSPTPTLS